LVLRFDFSRRTEASVIASTGRHDAGSAPALLAAERERRLALAAGAPRDDPFARALVTAADAFVVSRGEGKTVIAGYPWFTDWGRDTMIALPGLLRTRDGTAAARDILGEFAKHV